MKENLRLTIVALDDPQYDWYNPVAGAAIAVTKTRFVERTDHETDLSCPVTLLC
jgi:hypothetical protein